LPYPPINDQGKRGTLGQREIILSMG